MKIVVKKVKNQYALNERTDSNDYGVVTLNK